MPDKDISKFFREDYCQFAAYDVVRKIACVVDGLKMSARKVVHTMNKDNITSPKKVSVLCSRVAEGTHYLHGEGSLAGVFVGLAQNFDTSNNIPILFPDGNFGSRLIPEAAASRYIHTMLGEYFRLLFIKDDEAILDKQEFEGDEIEPRFFLPTLPLLFVNGTQGLSSGFSQKILPRDPLELAAYLMAKLDGKNTDKYDLIPYYRGFKGSIAQMAEKTFEISGKFTRVNTTKINVTEFPVGYTLNSYIAFLDKLEENRTIVGHTDRSNDDRVDIEIRCTREFSARDDDYIMKVLGLRYCEGEILVANDAKYKVKEYDNVRQMLDEYFETKLEYTGKRRDHLIESLKHSLRVALSKCSFIQKILSGDLVLNNRSEKDIVADLEKITTIIKVNDSYDYLLGMAISSLTKERYQSLMNQAKKMKAELDEIIATTPAEMWKKEIKAIASVLVAQRKKEQATA